MKKRFVLCLAALLLLAACGTKKEKSLYTQGLELISLMGEMAQSDTYFDMFSPAPEVKAQMDGIVQALKAGGYQEPKAVYRITADTEHLMELLTSASGANVSLDGMSPELRDHIRSRLFSSCASILNSSAGVEAIAASYIYTCSNSFVCREAGEDTAYLYTYEGACPVLVAFSVGEDHAVHASGFYILNENIADPESLSGLFGFSGFQVELLE